MVEFICPNCGNNQLCDQNGNPVSSIKALENKLLHLKRSRGIAKSHTQLALMEHKFTPCALPDSTYTGKD